MSQDVCNLPTVPVVVVASHEELLRSARDIWAVAVSLLTELTPDKFATAPWAAGLFTIELPFILSKLWHIQQGLLTAAHSYMQTESYLTTFLESIDISKLLPQLATWMVDLKDVLPLPIGMTQHVPPVQIMQPSDVSIIHQRFMENSWSNQNLVRHESYQLTPDVKQHWFYLPKSGDWDVINGAVDVRTVDPRLFDYIKLVSNNSDQILFVAERDGEVIIPDVKTESIEGTLKVFKLSD